MSRKSYEERREHLKDLTDEELKERFWKLSEEIMNPLVDLAKKNTSPSIERSVLLRMGFSSMESKGIVEGVIDRGLMSKGAGHVVYKLSKSEGLSVRDAGLKLLDGELWDKAVDLMKGGSN